MFGLSGPNGLKCLSIPSERCLANTSGSLHSLVRVEQLGWTRVDLDEVAVRIFTNDDEIAGAWRGLLYSIPPLAATLYDQGRERFSIWIDDADVPRTGAPVSILFRPLGWEIHELEEFERDAIGRKQVADPGALERPLEMIDSDLTDVALVSNEFVRAGVEAETQVPFAVQDTPLQPKIWVLLNA